MPTEGVISVLYWSMRAYDPSLLMPPDPRYQIPLALDLSLFVAAYPQSTTAPAAENFRSHTDTRFPLLSFGLTSSSSARPSQRSRSLCFCRVSNE